MFLYYKNVKKYKSIDNTINSKEKYSFIKSGITKERTNLYVMVDGKYSKIGSVEAGNHLLFSKLVDNYLLIKNLDDEYYVKINNISSSNDIIENDFRYKDYILFNSLNELI